MKKKNSTILKNPKDFFTFYMSWVVCLGQSMHYIQAWKIFTTKSANDISLSSYIICLIVMLHWFIYGIAIKNKIIIIAEITGIIGVSLVIAGIFIYPI